MRDHMQEWANDIRLALNPNGPFGRALWHEYPHKLHGWIIEQCCWASTPVLSLNITL